ncbi:MAG TPA: hypothetical protein VGO03_06425 [Acidimicrobiia bacterium]
MSDAAAYAALDSAFSVASDDVHVLELIDRLYAHCRTDREPEHRFEVVSDEVGWALGLDGVAVLRDAPASLALERLAWEVNQLAWRSVDAGLLIHAAAVRIDGTGVVLCAGSGRGKSTLALGLCERGAEYMSDEIAVVDLAGVAAEARCALRGFPRPIGLRHGSWPLVERFEPNCHPQVALFMDDVWFIAPPVAAFEASVDVLVFPIYDASANDRVEAIAASEAAAIVGDQAPNLARFGSSALDDVQRLVASATTARLVFSDLGAACDLVRDLVATGS